MIFGMYFYSSTNVPESGVGLAQHLTATPQLLIPLNGLVLNNWSSFSGTYLVPSNVNKVAIGFFNPNSIAINTLQYVVIDDVVITSCPPAANNTTSTASICETGTKTLVGSPSGGTWA
jgi:hypothetical protein